MTGGGSKKEKLDGRTEKRRQRLIKELKGGRGGRPLKPHDALSHTNELLEIGETFASLKKQGVKARKVDLSDDVLEIIKRHAKAFNFHPDAWRILSLRVDAKGDIVPRRRGPAKKARKTRKAAKKKRSAKKR
ncbi:MAG: hypothetical protein AAGE52_27730 [Myxococcota bacterium]